MSNQYPYASRLIVAADFLPTSMFPVVDVRARVMNLAEQLQGLGVGLKLNSGLRAMGYDVLDDIKSLGLHAFADLKLVDIEETAKIDGMLLNRYSPKYVTAMLNAGPAALVALVKELPSTTYVIGITVPTNWDESLCRGVYGCGIQEAAVRLAGLAKAAELRDIVLSAKENQTILGEKGLEGLRFNNPAIRPEWGIVKRDDQDPNRVSTVTGALQANAHRLIVGRPVTRAAPNDQGLPQNPREAVIRILDEMHQFYGPTGECTE